MKPSPLVQFATLKYVSYDSRKWLVLLWRGEKHTTEPGITIVATATPLGFRYMVVKMDPYLLFGQLCGDGVEDLTLHVSPLLSQRTIREDYLKPGSLSTELRVLLQDLPQYLCAILVSQRLDEGGL